MLNKVKEVLLKGKEKIATFYGAHTNLCQNIATVAVYGALVALGFASGKSIEKARGAAYDKGFDDGFCCAAKTTKDTFKDGSYYGRDATMETINEIMKEAE